MRRLLYSLFGGTLALLFATGTTFASDCNCAKPKVKFTVYHSLSPANAVKYVINDVEFESGKEYEFERDKEYVLKIAVASTVSIACDTTVYVEFPHCTIAQKADGASTFEKGGLAKFVLDCDEANPTAGFVIDPAFYKIRISDPKSDDAKSSPSPGSEVNASATPPSVDPETGSDDPPQPAGLALEIPLGTGQGTDGSYHSAGVIVNYGGVSTSFAAPSAFVFNALPEVIGGGTPPVSQTTVVDGSSQITEKHFIGPDAVIRLLGWNGSAAVSYTGASQSLFEVYDPSQYTVSTKTFSGSPHSYYRIGIATGNGMADGISITQSNRGVVRAESIQSSSDNLSTRHQKGPFVTITQMVPGGSDDEWSVLTTESRDGVLISKSEEFWLLESWGKALLASAVDIDDSTNGNELTTFYTYYEDGRLKSVSRPDSSWEFHEYFGTTTRTYSPWLSSALLTTECELPSSGFVMITDKTFSLDLISKDESVVITSRFTDLSWSNSGVVTSSTSSIVNEVQNLETEIRYRNASESLTSWTLFHPDDATPAWKAGRPTMSWDGSGKATLYAYDRGDWTEGGGFSSNANGLYTMESRTAGVIASPSSASNTSNFAVLANRSSRAVTITGPHGVVREETWICNASSTFEQETAAARNHEYETVRPFRHTGVKIGGEYVSKTEYDASPLITRTFDESGTQTETEVNAWGELVRTTTSGNSQVPAVTTLYPRTGRTRMKQIDSLVVLTEVVDVAGRVKSSEDATNAITQVNYSNGGRTVTRTAPGGVTTITDSHFDGRTMSVTGTAVIPTYYSYHLNGENEEEDEGSGLITETTIVGGPTSERVSSVTSNWDGSRAFSSSPDPSSPGDFVTLTYTYDTASSAQTQVESSAANTAVQISIPSSFSSAAALGMYSLSGQETDGNGPVIASTDRLVEADTVFEKPSGSSIWHRKTTIKHFHTDGSTSAHSSTSWTALAPVTTSHGTYGSGLRWTSFEVQGGRTITTNRDDHFATATSRVTVEDSATAASPDSERIAKHGRETSSAEYGTGSPRTTAYDASGRVLRQVSSSGAVTGYIYYPNGELKETRDHLNVATSYEYYPPNDPAAGRISKTTRAGESTETVYNTRGQVKETKGNGTYRVTWEYNTWGEAFQMRTYRTSTSLGDLTEWTYDPATGLLTTKTDAAAHEVNYTYHANGRMNQRKSQRNESLLIITTYSWDDFGASTGKSYDDGTIGVGVTPDRLGRPKSITDASGTRTLDYHSTNGALDFVTYTSGLLGDRQIDYTWDSSLRSSGFSVSHTAQTAMDFTAGYGYDDEGRILTVTGSGSTHTHAWLPGTNIPDGVSNSALIRTLHHDRMQRLRGIENKNGAGTVLTRHGYILDDAGRRTKATRENGQAWVYGYDSKGQVTSGAKYFPDGTTTIPGHSFSYTYDEIGNRLTANHGGNGMGVSYYGDTSSSQPGANALNQYGSVVTDGGRFILAESNSQVTVNSSNASPAGGLGFYWSQLSGTNTSVPLWSTDSIANGGSPVTGKTWTPKATVNPTYDLDGNLTWDGRWDYVWDAENRLVSMTTAAIAYGVGVPRQKLDFVYDCQCRRVAKTLSTWDGSDYVFTSHIRFLYDDWNLIAEYSASTATTTSLGSQTLQTVHTWGPDLSGAMQRAGGVGGLLSSEVRLTSTTCFPAYDGNGNISGWVKADGTPMARRDYSPFGQLIAHYKLDSSSAATLGVLNFGFSTKYCDAESGLLYYGYRYYDPVTGRWPSRDPLEEEGGVNLSGFLDNDGINRIDVIGLAAGDVYDTEYQAFRAASVDVKNATAATVIKGLAELKNLRELGKAELFKRIKAADGAYISTGDFSVFGATVAMLKDKGQVFSVWIGGIEHGTVVYCKSGKYYYSELSPGHLATMEELDDFVSDEDGLLLTLGHIKVKDMVIEMEEISTMGGVPLAVVHSHGMKVGTRIGSEAEVDVNTPDRQGLSDADKKGPEILGIPVCAIGSDGRFYCTGDQPK